MMALKRRAAGLLIVAGSALVGMSVWADTPAGQVTTQAVTAGGALPTITANQEEWFNVGGFCKVVDLGSVASFPAASNGQASIGIPIMIPGTAAQWENWRTNIAGVAEYFNQVTVTTCAPPQSNIATICAAGSNPTAISRQYGKLAEVDTVTQTCENGACQWQESINVTVTGSNSPDGSASWVAGSPSDVCTANFETNYGACVGACGTGSQTVVTYNSCGQVSSTSSQACDTGVPCCTNNWQASYGACSGSCGGGGGTQTVTVTNYGTCGGSYSYQQGCTNNNACHYWTQTWHVWPGTCSDEAAWQGSCPYGSFINSEGQCEPSYAGGCGAPPPSTYNGLVGSQCTTPGADGGTAVWNQVYSPTDAHCGCGTGGSYFATGTNCE